MKIVSARIRNYRTVQEEAHIEVERGLTLVGPNNAGKTNILKAIRMFFTGYDNTLLYTREHDLSFGQGQQKTNIAFTFRIDTDKDEDITNTLQQIMELLRIPSADIADITVYLTF